MRHSATRSSRDEVQPRSSRAKFSKILECNSFANLHRQSRRMLYRILFVVFVGSCAAFQVPHAVGGTTAHRAATPVAGMFDQFMPKEEPKEDGEAKDEKKLTLDGLMQVMAMGAGAPMLGDLKKTNFDKPESEGGAALQFELEANNFDLDDRGKYFDNGSTGTSTTYDNPSFFDNLMSGGKLQREYDDRMRQQRGEK